MKMWICRDEGEPFCKIFKGEKPHKYFDDFTKKKCWTVSFLWGTYMTLPNDAFPEVTFENSPMEVELVLKK